MTVPHKPSIAQMLDIRSLAVIGVTPKMGYYWAHCVLQWPNDLKIWLVSKSGGEALGHRIYTDVSEIPDSIDYAIIAVPHRAVMDVVRQCAAKGARGVTIFTSGFSELGTEEGRQRENALRQLLDELGVRALGPNCMGICYPRLGIAFMPTVKRLAGSVGFLSQSGGVAISVYTAGVEAGVGFSKLFSFGNQVDITSSEIMDYFSSDPETSVVGAYIEGTREGRTMMRSMRQLAAVKPVVVLKGGRSQEGSRVASSHTGALAGSSQIWSSALRQANIPTVATLEELVSTLSIFALCRPPASRNVGMLTVSGGSSVIYTDLCIEHGLRVPRTSPATVARLAPLIRDVGTGLGNPIDLAADYYQDQTISEVIEIAGEEAQFDSLIIEADVHNIYQVASIMDALDHIDDFWRRVAEACRRVMDEQHRPVLVVVPEVAYPEARTRVWQLFIRHGCPVFRSMRDAVSGLARVCEYYERQRLRTGQ